MATYHVIGLMSGTSLDGLDIAFCRFELIRQKWQFEILQAETIAYTSEWADTLATLAGKDAFTYALTDSQLGHLMGQLVHEFVIKHKLKPDFISSHGHTIFHQPQIGLTTQIGHGASLHATGKLPVICDFRTVDVALGGQGAPLVPIGDKLLFAGYDFCLNLGGISNISFDEDNRRLAFDICPVNIVLNNLANQVGSAYDDGGKLASQGNVSLPLLRQLEVLDFYSKSYPKSLGREWIDQHVFPLIGAADLSVEDKLATFCEHIAIQIAAVVTKVSSNAGAGPYRMLVTGGGAFNTYLINRLKAACGRQIEVIVPDKKIINYKEALIFAFLGVLRARNKENCLKSVTGASSDNIGGAIYGLL